MDVMALITGLTSYGGSLFFTIASFVFVLSIVVFFHELGHFWVARWCGVWVEAFSIGFGREIFGWTDKHGTRWKVAWIPLGGYVKFIDDDNAASAGSSAAKSSTLSEEARAGAFHSKSVWRRIAIVAAGPAANFILAIVIFTLLFSIVGRERTSARVDQVAENSAAAVAGFQPGDVILRIDDQEIASFAEMQRIVSGAADRQLEMLVERDGAELLLTATPRFEEITDRFGNVQRIGLLGISRGVEAGDVRRERTDVLTSLRLAVSETYFVIERTMIYLWEVIVGRQSADQLGGPIRIAELSGQVASLGIIPLINLAAFLSISIGLINLFPIPMLDGGHLLFYSFEALFGRPLSERVQEYGLRLGLALLLMLMVFVSWNDIARLWTRLGGA